MIHIFIYNILVTFSLVTFLILYTKNHCKVYWDDKYIGIPISIIFTKFIFVIFFYYYSKDGMLHDASTYYLGPVEFYPFRLGNHTMYIIGYFLRVYGHLSYLNSTLLLSLLAFFGLFFLLRCASSYYGKNKVKINSFYLLLFFFPSMHFWCIGFAKETFVFFSICWLCYKIFQQKKISFLKTILILTPVLFIRPHYLIFFVLAIMIYNYIKSDKKLRDFLLYAPVLVGSSYLLILSLDITFGGSFFFGLPELLNYVQIRQEQNIGQTMQFDITQFNSFELTWRFIFFPSLLDVFSINIFGIQFLLMVENTILLIFTIGVFIKVFIKKTQKELIRFYVLIFLIVSFSYSASILTANLGIIFRYKNMLYPVLIIIFLIMSGKNNLKKTKKIN